MGYSQHAGMVIVADGSPEAARRLERVLWNDPATGVMRHADAGYPERFMRGGEEPRFAGNSGSCRCSLKQFHRSFFTFCSRSHRD